MEAGEILVRRGLLNSDQAKQARGANGDGALGLVDAAVSLGFLERESALRVVGEEVGLEYIDLNATQVDLSLIATFPQKLIHRQNIFPVRRDNGQLVVATCDPFDLYPIDEASAATGLSVVPMLAGRHDIEKLIKKHLGVGSETVEGLLEQVDEDEIELMDQIETDGSELSEQAQEASVIRLVNEILMEAIDSRASDVHIESQASGLTVRYRIDGMLVPQPMPPEIHRFEAAIVSRLKIMSRLNIAEKRLPQDGRMKLRVAGREIDVRVSVIPMIHGESLVLRILDKGAMEFELLKLGMEEDTYKAVSELIEFPHGILLVTGPTGSGKTTTLYSSLIQINRPDVKIITTEDPVEYQLEGINQIQVHAKIGLTFSASLRSILRHDPDVVLVGEIRDKETAENAIQASLTGHLVFSTLHTNDAAGAFARMTDMGIEPFLVASTVEAVMAQRLVRRLCKHCKVEYEPRREDLPRDFPFERLSEATMFKSTGCPHCRGLGYTGRLGIYELLITSDHVRQLANDRASSWNIKKAGMENGMRTLRDDGWLKAIRGQTSVDEILRVTKGDESIAFDR
ncbi:MAG: ATPase, T2SS/T4P/T4SS family [Pirellulaceae bacterium]|nr:ATPase, T2SS/T4P/T4SS family [Pirellulaceae bacterium]MDP7017212.1 ATPase, T2SS/T4P/T4SS family [Pirellulaceae bacterium]